MAPKQLNETPEVNLFKATSRTLGLFNQVELLEQLQDVYIALLWAFQLKLIDLFL